MRAWSRLTAAIRFLFRRASVEREMDEELASFVEHRAEALERSGSSPEHAARRARAEAGSLEAVKDEIRDGYRVAIVFDTGRKDLAQAFRLMRRAPGFTAAVVLTLALGIGGTSAIFTLFKEVVIDPLPYRDPDRLVLIWTELGAQELTRAPASGWALRELRARSRSLEALGGIWATNATFLGDGRPEQIRIGRVTGELFDALGVDAVRGRTIRPEDEGEGKPPVLVLSWGLWHRRFGGRDDVIGRPVRMADATPVVVGVMPPGFRMVFPPDAQVSADLEAWATFPFEVSAGPRDLYFLRLVGRLAPGVTLDDAGAELDRIAGELRNEVPEFATDRLGFGVVPMHRDAVRQIRPVLVALFCGVGLVLLIACANVGGLMLAQAATRRGEMALRATLGASRGRLFRQTLFEGLVLAAVSGGVGVAFGWIALQGLVGLVPEGLLPPGSGGLDLSILGFTAMIALTAGIGFGLVPAWSGARVDLRERLGGAGRGGDSSARPRARAALVVAEIAMGFVLVVAAGLMARSFVEVLRVDPGFRPERALTFELDLPEGRYPGDAARVALVRRVEEALRRLPGVESVGGVSHLPLDDYPNWYARFAPAGREGEERVGRMADHRAVTAGYFRAVGAELVRGRWFEPSDEERARPAVVIDEIVAREGWPGEDPIGREIVFEKLTEGRFAPERGEVVGVVRHLQHHGLTERIRGQIYIPFPQSVRWHISFVLRTGGDPLALAPSVREAIGWVDPDLAVSKLRPMTFYVARAGAAMRLMAILAAVFAGLALMLSLVGVYGVVSYTVNRRVREFGIRTALGADPRAIRREVVGEGMKLAAAGLLIGAGGAVLVSRLLRALLFGVAPGDPLTWLAAAALIPATALAAAWLPARRAARRDPIAALRA